MKSKLPRSESTADSEQSLDGGFAGLKALESIPPWSGSRFSPIEVPKKLLEALGNPQNQIPTVHVAGTNGKGSVCADVAACLWASGASVGQFVSPHLSAVNERCMINGRPVGLADFDRSVRQVVDLAAEFELETSYFVVTAIATFLQFVEQQVDWAVVEVGLGGSFDATNLIARPRACVITRIALDHTHWLGETIEEIAENKAGIIKAGVPVFVGANDPTALAVCRAKAEQLDAPFHCYGVDFQLEDEFQDLPAFRRENRCLAIQVAKALGLSETAIAKGLRVARWPGRVESLSITRENAPALNVLIDGMHNVNGAAAFSEHLKRRLAEDSSLRRVIVVFAMRANKQWRDVVEILRSTLESCPVAELQQQWICTGANLPHTVPAKELAEYVPGAIAIDNETEALEIALARADEKSLVLIVGSLYLVGVLRPLLTDKPFRTIEDDAPSEERSA